MQTANTAGGMRLPGIGRPVNGWIRKGEVARVARQGDGVPGAAYWLYVRVTGYRRLFGVHVSCNPWELSDRVRTTMNHCVRVFLRRCGRQNERQGDVVPGGERES
jgi:hypothetical protein